MTPTSGRRPLLPPHFDPRRASAWTGRRVRTPLGRLWLVVATLASVAVLAVSTVGWATVSYFDNSIKRVTVKAVGKRPAERPDEMNVLLIGSDSRAGTNGEYGSQAEVGGIHSDSVSVAHLGADGSVTLVAIPRDTLVADPPGMRKNHDDGMDKFTDVLSTGGITATIAVVQNLTGLAIDHFVIIDLEGFKRMTDAVGGVSVCVTTLPGGSTRNLNDQNAQWHGHLGINNLNGDQALSFVRTRDALGDERLRIQRQQVFLSDLLRKATGAGVLTNPLKIASLISAVGGSLTVDSRLSQTGMITLAERMRKISGGARFITLPTHIALPADGAIDDKGQIPPHGDVLIYDRDKAEPVLAPLRPASENRTATASPGATVAPSTVTVSAISNASGRSGLASETRLGLSKLGFLSSGAAATTATSNQLATQVRYPTGSAVAANTLVAAIPGASAVADPSLTSGLVVVLGSSFNGLATTTAAGTSAAAPAARVASTSPAPGPGGPAGVPTVTATTAPPAPNCVP
ncbi:MAG: LCP family protein [Frankia sp.]